MYVSPWMQAALLPRKWDVCGIIVPPLSLWHVYVLRTSGNAYFCQGKIPDMDACAEVLMYAQRGIAEARALYVDSSLREKECKSIFKALSRTDINAAYDAISEYVLACTRTPGHRESVQSPSTGEKIRKVCAPIEWILAEYLASVYGCSIDEAFDQPYSVAFCMLDARRDISGDIDTLISEQDEKRIDAKLESWSKEVKSNVSNSAT